MIEYYTVNAYLVNHTRKEIVKFNFPNPSKSNNMIAKYLGVPVSFLKSMVNMTRALWGNLGWKRSDNIDSSGYDDVEENVKFDLEKYLEQGYVMKIKKNNDTYKSIKN
jgi:hypothetical protein